MQPLRKNVAVAIDGGGIKGVMVTRALAMLEEHLGRPVQHIFQLAAGTSTGSIIAAGIGAGLTAQRLHQLYVELGDTVFQKSWRTRFFPLSRYRYPQEPLAAALTEYIGGDAIMGDFWNRDPKIDVVITAFDLEDNHTRMIKPWKPEYKNWPVVRAVLASSTVPTYFPIVEGRYVDGGVGSYANPCYLAAFELRKYLQWDPQETTLISFGTGHAAHAPGMGDRNRLWPWQWLSPVLGGFLQSADDQQIHLVRTFFEGLDFRRFNVEMKESIEMDDSSKIPDLVRYGDELGRKLLNDETELGLGDAPTLVAGPVR